MTNPPIVIDTCAFDDRGFVGWLRSYRGEREVPPVVYCELAVLAVQRKGDTTALDGLLGGAGIEVSEMLMEHGRKAAILARGDQNWRQKWRDYMIAAHAFNPPYRLITRNVKDFQCIGGRVLTPTDFMTGIRNGTVR